jgi:hypothetical protein
VRIIGWNFGFAFLQFAVEFWLSGWPLPSSSMIQISLFKKLIRSLPDHSLHGTGPDNHIDLAWHAESRIWV